MKSSLSWLIAWRFMRTQHKSALVYLISFLSTLGIMLGVAALIIGLSAMNGFQEQLYQRVLSVIPNARIVNSSGKLENWQQVTTALQQQSDITTAIPYVSLTGLIEFGRSIEPIQIQGVVPQQEQQHWTLPQFVSGNGWENFSRSPQQSIIIGSGLATKLKIKVGDWVTLSLSSEQKNSSHLAALKRVRLQVVGLLNLSGELGYQTGIMSLQTTQQLLGIGDDVSGIAVNVTNPFLVNQIIQHTLNNLVFSDLQATTWTYEYGYIYQDIQMIRMIMYIAMVLVIGVACFNIVSTLMIAVKDKQSDIAILRTLGAQDKLIKKVFMYYGLLCGISGSVLGTILGVIASLYLSPIMNFIQGILGHSLLASDIYFIDFIPSKIHFIDVVLVFGTSVILSLLASGYPAYCASRLNPVTILKAQ